MILIPFYHTFFHGRAINNNDILFALETRHNINTPKKMHIFGYKQILQTQLSKISHTFPEGKIGLLKKSWSRNTY